jgi:subtilisin-like proprotein convertase family protein
VFDDAAARSISSAVSTDAPFTGSWRPETPLAALGGHSADGTWNLHVTDKAQLDVGSVRAFTLHVAGFVS